jgi:hypothetical protein
MAKPVKSKPKTRNKLVALSAEVERDLARKLTHPKARKTKKRSVKKRAAL